LSWTIDDSKVSERVIRSMPNNVKAKWEQWVQIIYEEGPGALTANPLYRGFKDAPKHGEWEGYRGSWLSGSWRVLYKAEEEELEVVVERVSNHDYRRRR
jgi:addiction module RelE/StbE family toxin